MGKTVTTYKQVYGNAQNICDILRLAMDEANASGATSSGASHTLKSCLENLKDLAELKRQGLITEEEQNAMDIVLKQCEQWADVEPDYVYND